MTYQVDPKIIERLNDISQIRKFQEFICIKRNEIGMPSQYFEDAEEANNFYLGKAHDSVNDAAQEVCKVFKLKDSFLFPILEYILRGTFLNLCEKYDEWWPEFYNVTFDIKDTHTQLSIYPGAKRADVISSLKYMWPEISRSLSKVIKEKEGRIRIKNNRKRDKEIYKLFKAKVLRSDGSINESIAKMFFKDNQNSSQFVLEKHFEKLGTFFPKIDARKAVIEKQRKLEKTDL